ncbi:Acg family FMN-binding oxidoreductase [Kitasatospora sp. NPDC101157]|uniref:Acg family FMN-binding oxidoreductase n=1 Tax=Kitasatospora sp. NPDC101157 TaxID=3364098 RepID=UPI0038095FCA
MTVPSLTLAELRLLAVAGGAAPSLHNSQPWRFRPAPDHRSLMVFADRARAVPLADPDGRALHISVGAAVFNLRTAARHLGRAATVALCPEPTTPDLLAVLDLSEPSSADEPDLYPAIEHRHSSRRPFANRDVPEAVLGELIEAATAEGATLSVLEEAEVRRVLALTTEAEQRISADIARQAETRGWLRLEEPASDGIPAAALGPLDHDARVPVRSFTGHPPRPAAHTERFEALPQVAVISTHGDHPMDWLRAGQAMERVWLLATLYGVRASVLHQAVEWADTRWRLRDPAEGPGHVQMVMRLGYGAPGAPTPRRAVEDVLDLSGSTDALSVGNRTGGPAQTTDSAVLQEDA